MTETDPENRLIGYARVSTYGQTLDAQLDQLRAAGCSSRNIYREKVTGARADQRELLRMLDRLTPGDVVTVTRVDRLARSTFDLFAIVKRIVDAGGQFRPLAEPWADTATSTGRLMIAVLGGLADVERDLIRTRTAEGRSRAKARGKHMGRPPSLKRHSRKRPQNGARRALHCRNWLTATTAASPPCAARHAPSEGALFTVRPFPTMHIISRSLRENQARLLSVSGAWSRFAGDYSGFSSVLKVSPERKGQKL